MTNGSDRLCSFEEDLPWYCWAAVRDTAKRKPYISNVCPAYNRGAALWTLLFTSKWAGDGWSTAESCRSLGSAPRASGESNRSGMRQQINLHLSSAMGTYLLLGSKQRGTGAVLIRASGRQDGSQGKVRLDTGPKGTTYTCASFVFPKPMRIYHYSSIIHCLVI